MGVSAGHCDVGPFGKSGDTAEYQGKCRELTAAERCLAYFKQHFTEDGQVDSAYDSAKATFCSRLILKKLD